MEQDGFNFNFDEDKGIARLRNTIKRLEREVQKWRISYFTLKKKYEDLLRSLQKEPEELPPIEWGK